MKRVRIIVDGRVQGIGFRYYVSKRAQEHDIKGYVRNMPDGRVEIDAKVKTIMSTGLCLTAGKALQWPG